jgi:hypothetical protein
MRTIVATDAAPGPEVARLADRLVHWLESGLQPDDLFCDDVFLDLSLPHWRLQTLGREGAFGLRAAEHPDPGSVRVEGLDVTARGFLLRFEERWTAKGQDWYSREMMHCVVDGDRVSELLVYCTGDWDAAVQRSHAERVRLIRP